MNKKDRNALNAFVTEQRRIEEQDFAATFSGNSMIELFFILENNSYTDGKSIVIDPHTQELFCDDSAWIKTIHILKDTGFSLDFTNRQLTLSWITKALNIHESSHVLYTNFPSIATKGKHSKTYTMILATVSNIIEDAFIDAKTIENYSNAYAYVYLFRILSMFRSRFFDDSTINDNLKDVQIENEEKDALSDILHYFSVKHIYPMFEVDVPKYLEKEIDYLSPLFSAATRNGDPCLRDQTSIEITEYLYKEILGKDKDSDEKESEEEQKKINDIIDKLKDLLVDFEIGLGTFNYNNNSHNGLVTSSIKEVKVVSVEELSRMLNEASSDVIQALNSLIESQNKQSEYVIGYEHTYKEGSLSKDRLHKGMLVKEILLPVDNKLKFAYERIKNNYKININSYNRQFTKLLKERYEYYGDKKVIGAILSSKNFADPKRRFWKLKEEETKTPDLCIVFMIDGSGSMRNIIDDAKCSLVMVHETLKTFNIKHSIVLHQALYETNEVDHYILLPFNARNGQEYNIIKPLELENTREGLSLFWVNKYLEKIYSEHKIIVMISDGAPYHYSQTDIYNAPKSILDTRNVRIKLESLGYTVIAVALDGCYNDLTQIYDNVIECNDITKLTGKLLQVISTEIDKY